MRFPNISRFGIAAVIAAVILVGAAGAVLVTQKERARDITRWQDKLDLIADARARDITGWVQSQFRELSALADNAALQVYFVTLQSQQQQPAAAGSQPPAQADYLRNLLTLTADRLGFQPPASTIDQQLRANVAKQGTGGLAMLDKNGRLLMATAGMPAISDQLAAKIQQAPRGQTSLLDIEQLEDGTQRIGFIVPIYAVQADHNAALQVGTLVGIKPIDARFTSLLTPTASGEKSLEVALVRREGDQLRYLTPLLDQSPLMSRREQNNEATSAAAYGAAHPSSFATRMDYRGQDVLLTSREIPTTPWVLLAKIDRSEALAESMAWRRTIIAVFTLLVVAMVTTLLAVWRHASARRAAEMTAQAQRYAAESEARANLLSLVTNHQPEPLYIVDADLQVWFTNQAASDMMKISADDARGKPLANLAGNARAQALAPHCKQALASGQPQQALLQQQDGSTTRHIDTRFVPLAQIPVDGLASGTRGVLVTEQDITATLQEREKRLHTLHQLVAMLVSLVDRRDPNAAQHSAQVATVAAATARDMGLTSELIETTETAARLMNLGKMEVPAELLMRTGTLNSEEKTRIRSSLAASAVLIEGIEFNGPVAETLRQAQEQIDGNGPLGLKSDAILISARIIAAANAIVSMLSPRAYRKSLSIEEAVSQLQADPRFDRKVVAAISNYLLNHEGKAALSIASKPHAA